MTKLVRVQIVGVVKKLEGSVINLGNWNLIWVEGCHCCHEPNRIH